MSITAYEFTSTAERRALKQEQIKQPFVYRTLWELFQRLPGRVELV
jgi:hypothetical protein